MGFKLLSVLDVAVIQP